MAHNEDDIPMPPKEEIEMAVEESLGHAIPGPAAERLAAIKQRITYLEDQINHVEPDQLELLTCYRRDLTEARHQLAEWKTQTEAHN